MAASTPTPSSEIIHLVTTFADSLDSLPPSLTRSLSDLKELDAVLNSASASLRRELLWPARSLSQGRAMPHTEPLELTAAHSQPPRPAGSLQSITDKLRLVHAMMHTPEPGSKPSAEPPKYTPLDRLKLLREVAEDARVFRLGGEDKIRVATNTCETVRLLLLSTLAELGRGTR